MPKQPPASEAKYRAIFKALRAEILGGRYAADGRFPSEAQLMRRFGGSRITVIHALQELDRAGFIVRRKGLGSFLTKRAERCGRPVGVIIPISRGEIFPPICHEITRLAQQDGHPVQLADFMAVDAGGRIAEARRIAERFVSQNIFGVIFHLTDGIDDATRINRAALDVFDAAGIPVVLTDCDVVASPRRSRYDVVGSDNVDAGYRLTRHLLDGGAKRLVFLMPRFGNVSFENRGKGFLAAVAEEPRSKGRIVTGCSEDTSFVKRLLRNAAPDAVICGNDRVAASLMSALASLGKKVPDDVRVAGFDDVNFARIVSPSLTTMHQQCDEIGATAYRTLLARVERPDLPPRTVSLSSPLVIRDSTGSKR